MPVLIDTAGVAREVPDDLVDAALSSGWQPETLGGSLGRVADEVREEEYGGVGGAIIGGAAALGRGATLGATDAIARAIGGDDAAIALEGYREQHPELSIGGEIIGSVAPALISGGSSLPAGAASLAGRAAGRAVGGGLRGAVTAGVVEGGLQGIGSGVTELALSTDPLTLERAASVLSSNALFGAGVGGVAGAVAHPVERGLSKAKALLDERMAAREAAAAVPGDLSTLDAKGLRAARGEEIERLAGEQFTARTSARSDAVDDVIAYRSEVSDANPWLVVDGPDAARLSKASRAMDLALDDAKGLRESPGSLLKPLRKEEQALEGMIGRKDEIAARLDAIDAKLAGDLDLEIATLPDAAKHVELTGRAARRYASFSGTRVPRGGSVRLERDAAAAFLDALKTGQVASDSRTALDSLDGLLERNRALQAKLRDAAAPLSPKSELASPRLTEIDDAMDVLRAPRQDPGLLEQAGRGAMFGAATGAVGSIPIIGQIPGVAHLIGAKAADTLTGLVFGRMSKAVGEVANRTVQAVKAFADAVNAAVPYVPVVATRVLQGVRYGLRDDDEPDDLPKLFKRRSDEVKALTEYDETGTPRVRPEVRAQLFERLKPVAAVDPIAADRMETAVVRRIEHVSGLIPRQPDFGGLAMPEYQPSDMEIRSWARTVAAAENPAGVEERATHGALSPEDVAAYWAVYPERAEDFKQSILAEIETGKLTLPYDRKLTLSMLLGQPLDPSLDPKVISILQGQFPLEPSSAGGAQAPRPQPQFGSMTKISDSAKTPAQERQS